MGLLEILIIAVGLSMDAFAVSIGKGLSMRRPGIVHYLKVGLWFGGFQALMPFVGYLLGSSFASYVSEFDHWIAFVLLAFIGGNMVRESFSKDDDNDENPDFSLKTMLMMAVATSIDALAAGVSFAFFATDIFYIISIIGVTTFVFSVAGLKIGNIFGSKYKKKSEFIGGLILVMIGLKILIEHMCNNC